MAFQPATIEGGHDPRVHHSEKEEQMAYTHEDNVLPDGSTPNIETYMYYAKIQRDKEAAQSAKEDAERGRGSLISRAFKRSRGSDRNSVVSAQPSEKNGAASSEDGGGAVVTEYEYRAASSALRTATWGSVFYLITTGKYAICNFETFHRFSSSLRYFGSLFHAIRIPTSWIWSWCRLLLRLRYHGCIQRFNPVVAVPETGLREVPGQVFR
jgi:hypothetical protein